jgi:predicted nicotinamide N-methyase
LSTRNRTRGRQAIARDAALVRGKTVLDVGCGVGLATFTAAAVGAKRVVAADIAPLTLRLVEKAAAELGFSVAQPVEKEGPAGGDSNGDGLLRTQVFDIMSPVAAEPLPPADLCLFADVLYNKVRPSPSP